MKVKSLPLIICLLAGLMVVSCMTQTPKVKPLSIDLPASYKTDSAAYYFIMKQAEVWNSFGKKVESMHRKGEKFRKKEFNTLSKRDLYNLVKLDYEYAALWVAQDIYLDHMLLEAEQAMSSASEQGMAKIIETQKIISEYYYNLALNFSKDLKLDKEPISFSIEEDCLNRAKRDTILSAKLDSIYEAMTPKLPVQ